MQKLLDTISIWKLAGISGDYLSGLVDIIWDVLNHIHELHFGEKPAIPEYTGEDVTEIINLAKKEGIASIY